MSNIAKISEELEKKLAQLNARANAIDEDLSEAPEGNWTDNATESEGDEVQERVGDMTLDEIAQIKRALSKIKAGTYDVCERCEGPIAIKRLEALPYATQCISCAAK